MVQAAATCERRVAAAVDTPAKPIDIVADEPDGREASAVVDVDHASLPREAYGTLSRHGVAEGHAAAQQRSSGCT